MIELLELAKEVSPYTIAGEGNVSMRVQDGIRSGFYIKASGATLSNLELEDLVLCDFEGNPKKDEKEPSMEVSFHAWILDSFPEVNCVCHTHPPHTTKIMCSGRTHAFANERMFPDQVVRNGRRSCLVPYATPGIKLRNAIKQSVEMFMQVEKHFPRLILLQNHGIITTGTTAKECAVATLMCEKSAEIFIGAKLLNNIKFLTAEEVDELDSSPSEEYRRKVYQ